VSVNVCGYVPGSAVPQPILLNFEGNTQGVHESRVSMPERVQSAAWKLEGFPSGPQLSFHNQMRIPRRTCLGAENKYSVTAKLSCEMG
jgi:hypothetical protein